MRRLLVTTAALLVFGSPAIADARSADNVVRASPSTDGAIVHRARVDVYTARGDTVDSTNLAEANPHDCTGCEGVAIAYQAIIVTGSPSDFRPQNLAVAVNSNCSHCAAFAYAYQYVVQTDGRGRLSSDARDELEAIEEEAQRDADDATSMPELDAQLQALADRFRTVVRDDLDRPHDGRGHEEQDFHHD